MYAVPGVAHEKRSALCDMDLKNNRGVHIAHCNVRSLAANFNVIKQQIHDRGIHIFTLSETWLNSNHASI